MYRDHFQITPTEHAGFLARGFTELAERRTGEASRLEESIDLYDEEIAFVDDQIQRLMTGAEESGWLDDAIVVIAADHGEGLNQHGMPGHGFIWKEQLRVPLIMRVPGETPRRIEYPVSLVDVAPTLLRFIDLPDEEAFLEQMTGQDRLDPDEHQGDQWLLGQASPLQSTDDGIHYTLLAAGWKLNLGPNGDRQLFHLDEDPDELVDQASAREDVADRMQSTLMEWLVRQRRAVDTEEASDAVREELRALGYGGDERWLAADFTPPYGRALPPCDLTSLRPRPGAKHRGQRRPRCRVRARCGRVGT